MGKEEKNGYGGILGVVEKWWKNGSCWVLCSMGYNICIEGLVEFFLGFVFNFLAEKKIQKKKKKKKKGNSNYERKRGVGEKMEAEKTKIEKKNGQGGILGIVKKMNK